MTAEQFNALCGSLPATTYVMQWGGAHVWKVGDKVFAIGRWEGSDAAVTFKTSDIAFEVLSAQSGLRPAPYLASRGLKWIQHFAKPGLSDLELAAYITVAHRIVASGLSKTKQRALGLSGLSSPPEPRGGGNGRRLKPQP